MTMNPERFRDLLDQSTADAPPAPPVFTDVEAGRTRLRRHRVAALAAATLAVVVAGGVGLATHGSEKRAVEPVTPPDAALVDACRNGPPDVQAATDVFYSTGTPLVRSAVATDLQQVVALESADGAYWAECAIARQGAEFPAVMDVYPSDPSVQDPGLTEIARSYGFGNGCGLVEGEVQQDCPTWALVWVDRLPDAVAAVRFDLADDTSPTVTSRDGYVVLNILHDRTDAIPLDADGYLDVPNLIRQITYLDTAGDPIAAEIYDESSTHPLPVAGLPQLSAYPPLRGASL